MAAVLPVAVYLHFMANAMVLMIVGVCRCNCAEGYNYRCKREKCFLHRGTFEWNGRRASYQRRITIH
jgi:hypothetical protein